MSVKRMDVTPFVAVTNEKEKKKRKPVQKQTVRASSMLIKLGICVSACLVALIVKATADVPVNAQPQPREEGNADLTEMLGRLEFVSLADVADVFARTAHPMPPAQGDAAKTDDGNALTWNFAQLTPITAAMDGTVRSIGVDETGVYVQLSHTDDVQTYYYGLDQVFVEQGQPVLTQDTLGEIEAGGALRFFVLQGGRPQDPNRYFNG